VAYLAQGLPERLLERPVVTLLDSDGISLDLIRLGHPGLDTIVQQIQQTGIASAEEAWDLVVAPLSRYRRGYLALTFSNPISSAFQSLL